MNKTVIASLLYCVVVFSANAEFKSTTVIQLHAVHSDGIDSWLERDTGQTRYDAQDSLEIGQLMSSLEYDVGDGLSLHGVLRYQHDQDVGLGITQLFAEYKPLWSAKFKPTFRAGIFYPEMSYENVDTGWLSPYTYSFSAINSWIAEEQRTAGLEMKLDILTAPRAAHKFSITAAAFKGNDTLGTLLAWRGWAIHDRQTVLNETVLFETYPSIGPESPLSKQAAWVEPSREIDGEVGFYIGGEWNYQNKNRLRYFYYDNNGDVYAPLAQGGQFAWKTRYHSLAWQYRFNRQWRLLAQILRGDTAEWRNLVTLDFSASYVMLNFSQKQHRFSLRYDWFDTVDTDTVYLDNNDGDGDGYTLAYKYVYSDHWQFGIEHLSMDTFRANRAQWPARDVNVSQHQTMAVAEYRF
ncbi:MAG: hypothetical protein ACFHVJ_02810 [Aestuariibacter sp.]